MRRLASSVLASAILLLGVSPSQADYVIPQGTTWGENSTVDDTTDSDNIHTLDSALNCEENSEYGYGDEGAFALLCLREVIKHQKNIGKAIAISLAKNISLYGFESKFVKNGNYKKLLELDKKKLLNNDLIKPLYSS